MTRKILVHGYDDIISVENLLEAWKEFKNSKRTKEDVALFDRNLMDNIFQLHRELSDGRYAHSSYKAFKINDPKPRDIHKASVRDRLMHHAIYRQLYWFFDRKFIYDSYSCRVYKGTHKAMDQFRTYFRKVSKNDTRMCWVLRCDIRKFFASIDHKILKKVLRSHIQDEKVLLLLDGVVDSFSTAGKPGIGLPLGNLTSQLLVNVYMNEFDQFVKHKLKQGFYIRYADDFVFLHEDKHRLKNLIPQISEFLENELKLFLHPNKVFIKTFASGVDFLGWVHFPHHRVLRTATKRRMMNSMSHAPSRHRMGAYLGMLSHGNGRKLARKLDYGIAKKFQEVAFCVQRKSAL
jgi:retron-type reverse transcriptase